MLMYGIGSEALDSIVDEVVNELMSNETMKSVVLGCLVLMRSECRWLGLSVKHRWVDVLDGHRGFKAANQERNVVVVAALVQGI